MIDGGHVVLYSQDADRDRAFFKEILGFPHADAGEGWLIFRLPPSEIAVHPASASNAHEFYLTCDDLESEIARRATLGVACDTPSARSWGVSTFIHLPGGGRLGLHQPRHQRPPEL